MSLSMKWVSRDLSLNMLNSKETEVAHPVLSKKSNNFKNQRLSLEHSSSEKSLLQNLDDIMIGEIFP